MNKKSQKKNLQYWLQALANYYSAPLHNVFKQFRDGAIYFAVGLIIVYLANTNIPPSAKQDLIVLAGLCLSSVGFFIAMLAQTRLVIGRIIQFILKK